MRKLASVVRVGALSVLPGADGFRRATLEGRGWQVVVPAGRLAAGGRAVYFEIDSVLPLADGRFTSLAEDAPPEWVREAGAVVVRSARIGGALSQGALLPLDLFPELADYADGADVTERLGVSLDRSGERVRGREEARGPFPGFVPKTDEERIQNLPDFFRTMRGRFFEVTEKLDGTSMTVFHSRLFQGGSPFRVCSRNLDLRATEESPYWRVARKYDLPRKLRTWARELAFQGELVGPGVNGNRGGYAELEWRVFRIWDIARACFLETTERRALCRRLGIPHVPIVNAASPVFDRYPTLNLLMAAVDGPGLTGRPREGLVFKEAGRTCPISFKAVSNRYLLAARTAS